MTIKAVRRPTASLVTTDRGTSQLTIGYRCAALAARGYQVVGLDLSADQLRIARTRHVGVVRADAGRVPSADRSIPVATNAAATMTLIHTVSCEAGALGRLPTGVWGRAVAGGD